MTSSFVAKAGAAEEIEDVDCFIVALAEEPDGSGARLEIQIALWEPDPQDVALGQDTYCLCTQQGATCYGGVTAWCLRDRWLHLWLDERAADTLGLDDEIAIELDLPADTIATIAAGIERALEMTQAA
jgi:hypothetical protein